MSLANVYIGAAPNDGTGDPLRSAFNTINQNFANLAYLNANSNVIVYSTGNATVNAIYNAGVVSVAGRNGNVTLSVSDVIGAASIGYVNTVSANLANAALGLAATLTTVTWANVTGKPVFANIATTGSWNDLSDIPVNVSNAVGNGSTVTYTAGGHSFGVGTTVTITELAPSGYNGTFVITAVVAGCSSLQATGRSCSSNSR